VISNEERKLEPNKSGARDNNKEGITEEMVFTSVEAEIKIKSHTLCRAE
jgi:hypothetical protein